MILALRQVHHDGDGPPLALPARVVRAFQDESLRRFGAHTEDALDPHVEAPTFISVWRRSETDEAQRSFRRG